MLRALVLLLALAAAACSDRELEEERPSRRHLAADWCEELCTFSYDCDPIRPASDCRQRCESDAAWDWIDECGDLMWAYRQCLEDLTCEEARDGDEDGTPFCQSHYDDFVARGCRYEQPNGG